MNRRTLMKISALASLNLVVPDTFVQAKLSLAPPRLGQDDRAYWVNLLERIASPILMNISKDTFRKNMRMEVSPIFDRRDPGVGYLEAFARLLAGMAPWLALPDDETSEGKIRKLFRKQALQGIANGVNPDSADYFSWRVSSTQPLVDAAHLVQAFMRAPNALWEPLPRETKAQLITELKLLRRVKPNESNWLLFAAMTETFLYTVGEEPIRERIEYAIHKFEKDWYVGDGWYSDGERFSFDHYNGYVIHCMLVEVLKYNYDVAASYAVSYDVAYKRMQRYGHHLERMISPDGYPLVVGRSSTYRNAAFQPLALLVLDNELPSDISKGQVRSALTSVLKNTFVPSTFQETGWLTMGVVGSNQTNLADYYTNAGSMYVASLSFLPLGLPATDQFWTCAPESWTSQKIWKGEHFPKDYYVKY